MKHNELRIGNIISYKPKGSVAPLRITIKNGVGLDAVIGNSESAHYTGIELTKEWLVKLGFKCVNPDWEKYTIVKGIYKIDFFLTTNLLSIYNLNDDDQYFDLPDIFFVHQLQNLAFSLTGKELIAKNPMKNISQDLLQKILRYIEQNAIRMLGHSANDDTPPIKIIREHAPEDESVALYDKVKSILEQDE